jgi:hypothetical protein
MAGWKHLETMGTPLAGSGSLRAGLRVAFEDRSGSRWLHPFLRLFATAHRPLPRFYAMSYDISCSNGWGSEIRCWLPMFQYQARLPKVSQFWSIPMSSSMVPHVCKSPKINHAFWVLFKLLREKKKGWSSHILPFFHIFSCSPKWTFPICWGKLPALNLLLRPSLSSNVEFSGRLDGVRDSSVDRFGSHGPMEVMKCRLWLWLT